jgi:hypothetical protein
METNLLKLKYLIEKYKRELISFLITLVTAVLSVFLGRTIYSIITILMAVISFLITIYFLVKEKDLFFVSFNKYDQGEDWLGSGIFKLNRTNKGFEVANTDAGFIFSKCLNWSNYEVSGQFKLINKNLGVIVRANDLSTYIMIQFNSENNTVRPHYFANGGFVVKEAMDTGLRFTRKLQVGKWYKFKLIIDKEKIEINVSDKKVELINKFWMIKEGISNPRITIPIFPADDKERKNHTHNLDVPVSYDYGSIGFRCGHDESAIIKNILVKNI